MIGDIKYCLTQSHNNIQWFFGVLTSFMVFPPVVLHYASPCIFVLFILPSDSSGSDLNPDFHHVNRCFIKYFLNTFAVLQHICIVI